jgi:hypothetical protein
MATNYPSLVIGLSFEYTSMVSTIPSIGLLYFFKHYKTVTGQNFIIANVVAISILLFIFKLATTINYVFLVGTEVFTVNELGNAV